jgi:hypothetical protein
MDPNETAPKQRPLAARPTSRQPLKTVQLPDHDRGSRINSDKDFSWTQVWRDFRRPVKQIGTLVIGLFILGFLTSFLFNSVKGLFTTKPTATPANVPFANTTTPDASTTSTTSTAPATTTKCGNGKISSTKVDRVFYAQHPELNGRRLASTDEDKALRADWCAVADRLSQ